MFLTPNKHQNKIPNKSSRRSHSSKLSNTLGAQEKTSPHKTNQNHQHINRTPSRIHDIKNITEEPIHLHYICDGKSNKYTS